jgi:hypothetical protein
VEVYLGSNGASTDVGRDYTLLAAYEPTATPAGSSNHYCSGLAAPASGRLAFRYVVDDTSLNGDYIGIDSVSVTAIPEPATVALVPRRDRAACGAKAALAGNGGPVCRRPRRRPERMA